MAETDNMDSPVLHVLVIGFHHKKGCQVEYAYPPLIPGNRVDSNEVPLVWKHLPSLAIPDGAHNFTEDTVFFHLPAKGEKLETVYGVSCYRQIDSTELRNRGADVTRNSVQKSVCVLSRLPLYGLIQAKLELITHAYFDERDFSQVALLEDTYKNLCASLKQNLLDTSQVFLGLSSREMVQRFKHKLLILFKLMLLERRVLFFGSPVKPICTAMLSVLSLFPRLLEYGLQESASYSPTRQLSPTLKVTRVNSGADEANDYLEVHYMETPSSTSIRHAEREEQTATKVNIGTGRSTSSSSTEEGAGSGARVGRKRKDSGSGRKGKPSPGYPVKVAEMDVVSTDVEGTARPRVASGSDDMPGIHRQCSKESQGSTSAEVVDHPLSGRYRSASGDDVNQARERRDSGSKRDKDRNNLERKLEQTTAASGSPGGAKVSGDSPSHSPVRQSNGTVPSVASAAVGAAQEAAAKLKRDPLEFVQEITKVSSVQKHLQRLSSSGHSGSLPDEELTPDERELLADADECAFSWQEDKLLLEINQELESPDVFGASAPTAEGGPTGKTRTLSGTGGSEGDQEKGRPVTAGETPGAVKDGEEMPADGSTGVTRAHNLDLEVDVFGDLAANSDVDDGGRTAAADGVKSGGGKSLLRTKLSAWSSGRENSGNTPLELTEIRPVTPSSLNVDEFGFPISIFTKGMLCHPYLSLQFYDLLQDINVRGFAIGATNVLYKQKRHLLDAIVDVTGEGKIEIHDPDLRRQVNLTTADLRFADYLVKATVTEGTLFLDDTSWEGGDEWLRSQFRQYLLSLLAVAQTTDEKMQEDFNLSFLAAWKTTHNYKLWRSTRHPGMVNVSPAHPYHGQVTMADMKLKLAHSLASTERGKKVNAAMATTGKVVLQTGKAVGGAITSAKSAVSSWFSSWRQPSVDKSPESPSPSEESPVKVSAEELIAPEGSKETEEGSQIAQEYPSEENLTSSVNLTDDLKIAKKLGTEEGLVLSSEAEGVQQEDEASGLNTERHELTVTAVPPSLETLGEEILRS